MDFDREQLLKKRDELCQRLDEIERDYRQGLDPDSEEQAIQLENAEVLEAIAKSTSEQIQAIEKQLAEFV